jgi:uncharacterized membrane protein
MHGTTATIERREQLGRSAAADARGYRLSSLDMLRGLVIVIMALDHVRDSFHLGAQQDPMADPNIGAALFFTRWITHFCAPVFVFLAGTSAGLMAARRSPSHVGAFLLKRGLWLIAVEWFVIATAITFAPGGIPELQGQTLVIFQVIWAIGASMIVLAGAQFLGRQVCLVFGIVIVAGHNLLDPIWPSVPNLFVPDQPLWVGLHAQISFMVGPFMVAAVYPVLAWIGVMLCGYGASAIFEQPAAARNRQLIGWGGALTAAFVLLRAVQLYGDPNSWTVQPGGATSTVIDFLNVTKYPPSLLFLLMTLGPAAIFASYADRVSGGVKDVLVTYGRVPFAFYVVHFYVIHTLTVVLGMAQGYAPSQLMTIMFFYPKGYGVSLPWVYVVWVLIVAGLYPWCRWVASVKARRTDWWLSYL